MIEEFLNLTRKEANMTLTVNAPGTIHQFLQDLHGELGKKALLEACKNRTFSLTEEMTASQMLYQPSYLEGELNVRSFIVYIPDTNTARGEVSEKVDTTLKTIRKAVQTFNERHADEKAVVQLTSQFVKGFVEPKFLLTSPYGNDRLEAELGSFASREKVQVIFADQSELHLPSSTSNQRHVPQASQAPEADPLAEDGLNMVCTIL